MEDPSLLSDAGRALFGGRWQSDMARALGVSDRTVRRWAVGTETPRPGVYVDLMRVVAARRAALGDIEKRLETARSYV